MFGRGRSLVLMRIRSDLIVEINDSRYPGFPRLVRDRKSDRFRFLRWRLWSPSEKLEN